MNKFTLSLVFLLTMVIGSYGQVTVGEGTNVSQNVPFNAYYGYSYSQTIYLASEINASGTITSVQWYYNGSGAMPNSQELVIYLGHTTKNSFVTDTDFVNSSAMTQVYAGGIITDSTPGWKTITLSTPFVYNGTSNLIVAVDENKSGYDAFTDKFRCSETGANRTIYSQSDSLNIDPSNPDFGTPTRARLAFLPNIIFGGIQQACPSVTAITASMASDVQVTIGWTAVTGQTDWEVYVVQQAEAAPTNTTSGILTSGTSTFLKTGLVENTAYSVYVRAKCSDDLFSAWIGPKKFRTLCTAFGNFEEDLTGAVVGVGIVPDCWTKTVVSTDSNATISVISNNSFSAPNALYMTNATDANAQMFLVTPALTAIGANTHRIKFSAKGNTTGYSLIVGTMSDPTDPSTFVEIQNVTLTNLYTTYNVSLNNSTSANHVAFKHGQGGTYRLIYIDDVIWEPIPTAPPSCIETIEAVTNATCGNFPTTITWNAVQGADGYRISIGTSASGGDLIVDNVELNSLLNYSFIGTKNTIYYYTVTPYNANGAAVECPIETFTTFSEGCYCVSVPTSNHSAGISNVQIGESNFPVTDVTYADFSNVEAVEITQGVNTIMNITLATGYAYYTEIWIDFNDNFIFEPTEHVYSGQAASNANPYTTNTSFIVPLTANVGTHRMRTVSTSAKKTPALPCYNGAYGITLDFEVNVLPVPSCLPPTATTVTNITFESAQINWVSTGTVFNVEYDYVGFVQGSGSVVSGISGNSTTLVNLTSQQNYSYYVQTVCGTDLSPWTGPFLFKTACESFGEFIQDFTTETNISAPECWYTIKQSSNQAGLIIDYAYNDYMQFSNSSDAAAALYLVTPGLTALSANTHRVKFRAYSDTVGASIMVGTMSDPADASTFTLVQTIPVTNTFLDYSVAFVTPTTDLHIAFKFVGTATYQTLYLDDVAWELAPSCPDLNTITFQEATAYTATISWVPAGTETTWQYVYDLASETEPLGLTTYDVNTTSSATLTGLEPSTTYKVWVRATCGSDFGQFSAPITFTTGCASVSAFPWNEGFENITPGYNSFPICWSKENGDFTTFAGGTYNSARTGTNYLRDAWSAVNEYMWTPGFNLTAGVSYDFSFYMQGDGFTGWAVDVFQNTIQNSVGATQLGVTTTASGMGQYIMQPYALVSNTIVPETTGVYYFAIRVNQPSFAPNYIAFDDFKLELTPTCLPPLAPTATNATATTATLNWTAATPVPAFGYDYYVSSNLVQMPNATTEPSGTVGAGITTANLTELLGSTFYKVYVRSICLATDKSSWSDAGTFTTSCVTAVLPYTINFESVAIPNMPICTSTQNVGTGNNWVTVNNPGSGFTSKTLRYAYNQNNAANTWFYTNIVSLVAGTQYSISYLYGNNSTFYTERLKVAYGVSADAASMVNVLANHSAINYGVAQDNNVPFTPAISGDYIFGFNAYSNSNQDDLFVDNIVIQEVLGTNDFDNKSFSVYPNPVKDILNVSFTQNILDVTVYNLLGQKVLFMNMNANKGQVDMSTLTSGTYLVKVNAENGVKTIKVIKE